MSKFTHLSSLVFNQPLLTTEAYAETLAVVLSDRIDLNVEGLQIKSDAKEQRPVSMSGGTQIIPIVGSMSHRATGIEAMSGMTSYTDLQKTFEAAFNNPNVSSILMDIDSPGGHVAGAFDFRDYLMANKGRKPIYALARDSMCSAAYLIGSTADKLYTTQTGRVGSIGVVAMHVDRSEKDKKDGIKPTFIKAGAYKTAGNPHEALEGDNLQYLQDSVNDSMDMFVKAVVEARGLDEKVVRDTEARVYTGEKAVKLGLADGVRTLDQVLGELSSNKIYSNYNTGMKMENIDLEKLSADLTENKTQLTALTAKHEKLQKQVLDAGYSITAEGLVKEAPEEMIDVEGVSVNKATLPAVVVKALEAKAAQELQAKATAEYPNLKADVAVKLYTTFAADAEMSNFLRAFDAKMADMMEEKGDSSVLEAKSAKDKLEDKLSETMKADNITRASAYAKIAATKEGAALINATYKE